MIKEKSVIWIAMTHKLGRSFSKLPISPNFITWLTLPTAILAFIAIANQMIGLGITIFVIAGLLDIIDGPVARYLGTSTGYGAFLDGSLDRIVDFLVIFSYFWIPIITPWLTPAEWIALAVFLAIMPSFEVAYANHRKAVYDPEEKRIWRILNRGEMFTLMLLVTLISQFSPTWAGYLLITLVTLSGITYIQTCAIALYIAAHEKYTHNG